MANNKKGDNKMNKCREVAQLPGYQGNLYQMKLLLLFLQRGLKKYTEFELGTEIEEAHKFDDLVFKYKKMVDGKEIINFILLQSKHKTTADGKITYENILTDANGDFGLVKYFNAFAKAKNEKMFQDGVIEHAIIFTNINFDLSGKIPEKNDDLGELKNIENIIEEIEVDDDSSLSLCKNAGCKFYRFKSDLVIPAIKPMLSVYHMIAQKLIKALVDQKNYLAADDGVLKDYHRLLAKEVIDVNKKKLREDFIAETENVTGSGKLRSALNDVANKQGVNLNEIIRKTLSIRKNFGNAGDQQIWPDDITNADMQEFFQRHVFATGQPDEYELGKIILSELGQQYAKYNADLMYGHFSTAIQEWMTAKKSDVGKSDDTHTGFITRKFISFQEAQGILIRTREKFDINIFKGPTVEYDEYINKYNLGFVNSEVENTMKNFMIQSNTKLLNIVSEHIVMSSIKVYQELIKHGQQFIYTRMSSLENSDIDLVNEAFEFLPNVCCLVIESDLDETKQKEINDIYNRMIETIKRTDDKKVILISHDNDILKNKLKSIFNSDGNLEIRDTENTLADFTNDSQSHLLKMKITFQGNKVELADLLINDDLKKIMKGADILKLLNEEDVEIGKKVEELEDEKCYINRTFTCKVKHEKNIYLISDINEENLYLEYANFDATEDKYNSLTENESEIFEQTVEENSSSNIFVLRKTQGQFYIIQKEVEEEFQKSDFHNAMICGNDCQLNLITAVAGMGKSTLFTYLSEIMKKQNPKSWVVKINLNNVSPKLNQIKRTNSEKIEMEQVVDLLHFGANHETELEKTIFEHFLLKGDIVLLFDAFDEISPYYKELVLAIIDELRRKTDIKKIWLSTRPYDAIIHDVEKSFPGNTLKHYDIQPFTKNNQTDYLKMSWARSIEIDEESFAIFTAELFRLLSENIKDGRFEFLGIALHTVMIGVTFKDIFNDFQNSESNINECQQELMKTLQLSELYEKFVKNKFEIYWVNKNAGNFDKVEWIELGAEKYDNFLKRTTIQALDSLLDKKLLNKFLTEGQKDHLEKYKSEIKETGDKIGIVNRIIDNKPHFIHRTFSEYFVAVFIVEALKEEGPKSLNIFERLLNKTKKDSPKSSNIIQLFLNKMIVDQNYSVICQFVDSKLGGENSIQNKNCNKLIKKVDENILHHVLRNKWSNIAIWLVEGGINCLNNERKTPNALHLAFPLQNSKLSSLLLATKKNEPKKLAKFLSSNDSYGKTPLFVAVQNGRLENVKCILKAYADSKLKTIDYVTMIGYFINSIITNAAHRNCDFETFIYVLKFIKNDPGLIKHFSFNSDARLYLYEFGLIKSVENGQLNKLKAILDEIIKLEIYDEIFDKGTLEYLISFYAIYDNCDLEIFDFVLSLIGRDPTRLKNFLIHKNIYGKVVLNELIQTWQFSKIKNMMEKYVDLKIVDSAINSINQYCVDLLQRAVAKECDYDSFHYILNFIGKDPACLKRLLLQKDDYGNAPFNLAILSAQINKIKAILDASTTQEIQRAVLTNVNTSGENMFHQALNSENKNNDVVIFLFRYMKNNPLKTELLLQKDNIVKKTVLDMILDIKQLPSEMFNAFREIVDLEILNIYIHQATDQFYVVRLKNILILEETHL